jgi:glutathione synthase/RimK-type ligase-like ATP-grasp enzyme
MLREALVALHIPYATFDQRRINEVDLRLAIAGGSISGSLTTGGQSHDLAEFTGIYNRLISPDLLPEMRGRSVEPSEWLHCLNVHDNLLTWLETVDAPVANTVEAMGSNASKGYQLQLIRSHGFSIPETLMTNDPERVVTFWEQHRSVIYKSISSNRSIVRALTLEDLIRLDNILWCPVQFQQYVEGVNIRVHTIGESLYASRIDTNRIDYRYAFQEGGWTEMSIVTLPRDVADMCRNLAHSLDLHFAGIDLILGANGDVYCLEVNPSPAFNYYELRTGQPIARELALFLSGEEV